MADKKDKTPSLDFLKNKVVRPNIRCPKCDEADFDVIQNQWEIIRTCRKCKNQWSGGSMGAALPNVPLPPPSPFIMPEKPAPPAEEDPELDIPTFLDSPFRRI